MENRFEGFICVGPFVVIRDNPATIKLQTHEGFVGRFRKRDIMVVDGILHVKRRVWILAFAKKYARWKSWKPVGTSSLSRLLKGMKAKNLYYEPRTLGESIRVHKPPFGADAPKWSHIDALISRLRDAGEYDVAAVVAIQGHTGMYAEEVCGISPDVTDGGQDYGTRIGDVRMNGYQNDTSAQIKILCRYTNLPWRVRTIGSKHNDLIHRRFAAMGGLYCHQAVNFCMCSIERYRSLVNDEAWRDATDGEFWFHYNTIGHKHRYSSKSSYRVDIDPRGWEGLTLQQTIGPEQYADAGDQVRVTRGVVWAYEDGKPMCVGYSTEWGDTGRLVWTSRRSGDIIYRSSRKWSPEAASRVAFARKRGVRLREEHPPTSTPTP